MSDNLIRKDRVDPMGAVLLLRFLIVISLHFMAKLFFITKTRKLESTKFRSSFFRVFVISCFRD
jgi:hypothetical protein